MTRAGLSILTETVDDDGEFSKFASAINGCLPMMGAWFFQVKRAKSGELCLMEVAPRVPGAMALHRELGVNFALLSVYVHLGRNICIQSMRDRFVKVSCCKIYANHFRVSLQDDVKALYVDLDDTLLYPVTPSLSERTTANPQVMSLLYEALAANIRVYLVTRHKGDVLATLKSARISGAIFQEIHHITDPRVNKLEVITDKPAIFLDDSFQERTKVSEGSSDVISLDVDALALARDLVKASIAKVNPLIKHEP